MAITTLASLLGGPQTIYHYTSQEGLLGILRSKCLWATSIRHLNDATEFSYAAGLARVYLDKISQSEPEDKAFYGGCRSMLSLFEEQRTMTYVASFSADEGDRLSQWRAYSGRGVGFSIGFDFQKLSQLAQEQGFTLERCTYNKVRHETEIEKLIVTAKTGQLVAGGASREGKFIVKFLRMAPTMKAGYFQEENEWRLVSDEIVDESAPIEIRSGKSMLVPYIKFDLKEADSIVELVVGPTPHKELSASALGSLRARHNNLIIRTSDIPYRDW